MIEMLTKEALSSEDLRELCDLYSALFAGSTYQIIDEIAFESMVFNLEVFRQRNHVGLDAELMSELFHKRMRDMCERDQAVDLLRSELKLSPKVQIH